MRRRSLVWARYVSSCREHHELGHFAASETALGVEFVADATRVLTLRHTGADTVELCGARCQSLRREVPALAGGWYAVAREHGDFIAPAGELVGLDLKQPRASLQVGDGVSRGQSASGKVIAASLGADRFTVEFTPEAAAATLNGVGLAAGVARTSTARRLAGQRLAVCEGERCVTLERSLDAYDHGVR